MLVDILIHYGLDITGGLTLTCLMGMCEHKRHQYAVWLVVGLLISIVTVHLVG